MISDYFGKITLADLAPVSYTHLDVYKRQHINGTLHCLGMGTGFFRLGHCARPRIPNWRDILLYLSLIHISYQIEISIGCARLEPDIASVHDLIDKADQEMYHLKTRKRGVS